MSEDQAAKAAKPVKMVKIKLLRDAIIDDAGNIALAGTACEVPEHIAKNLCDTNYSGYHPFYGNMPEIGPRWGDVPNPLARKQIVRAVLRRLTPRHPCRCIS